MDPDIKLVVYWNPVFVLGTALVLGFAVWWGRIRQNKGPLAAAVARFKRKPLPLLSVSPDNHDDDYSGGDVLFISCTDTWIVVAPFALGPNVSAQDTAIAEWEKLQVTMTEFMTPSEIRRAQLRDAVDGRLKAALGVATEWLMHAASPVDVYVTSRNNASSQLMPWLRSACKNTPALQGKQVNVTHILA